MKENSYTKLSTVIGNSKIEYSFNNCSISFEEPNNGDKEIVDVHNLNEFNSALLSYIDKIKNTPKNKRNKEEVEALEDLKKRIAPYRKEFAKIDKGISGLTSISIFNSFLIILIIIGLVTISYLVYEYIKSDYRKEFDECLASSKWDSDCNDAATKIFITDFHNLDINDLEGLKTFREKLLAKEGIDKDLLKMVKDTLANKEFLLCKDNNLLQRYKDYIEEHDSSDFYFKECIDSIMSLSYYGLNKKADYIAFKNKFKKSTYKGDSLHCDSLLRLVDNKLKTPKYKILGTWSSYDKKQKLTTIFTFTEEIGKNRGYCKVIIKFKTDTHEAKDTCQYSVSYKSLKFIGYSLKSINLDTFTPNTIKGDNLILKKQ